MYILYFDYQKGISDCDLFHDFQTQTVQKTCKGRGSRFLRLDRGSTEVEP